MTQTTPAYPLETEDSLDRANLFVKFLPPSILDHELHALFSPFGEIVSCKVMVSTATGESLGYGFVRFAKETDAQTAQQKMNRFRIGTKNLLVKPSNPLKQNETIVANTNLYIKPILRTTTENDLYKLFSPFGEILGVKVMLHHNSSQKHIAFVRFKTQKQADLAMRSMNGYKFNDYHEPIIVRYAETESIKRQRLQKKTQVVFNPQAPQNQTISFPPIEQNHQQSLYSDNTPAFQPKQLPTFPLPLPLPPTLTFQPKSTPLSSAKDHSFLSSPLVPVSELTPPPIVQKKETELTSLDSPNLQINFSKTFISSLSLEVDGHLLPSQDSILSIASTADPADLPPLSPSFFTGFDAGLENDMSIPLPITGSTPQQTPVLEPESMVHSSTTWQTSLSHQPKIMRRISFADTALTPSEFSYSSPLDTETSLRSSNSFSEIVGTMDDSHKRSLFQHSSLPNTAYPFSAPNLKSLTVLDTPTSSFKPIFDPLSTKFPSRSPPLPPDNPPTNTQHSLSMRWSPHLGATAMINTHPHFSYFPSLKRSPLSTTDIMPPSVDPNPHLSPTHTFVIKKMDGVSFYADTKMFISRKAVEQVIEAIKADGIKKVLCLLGGGSTKTTGLWDRITKSLKENGIEYCELWGVQPNPLISKVREGVAMCKDPKNKIEAVLAIGGGSVIDSCKAITAGAKFEGDIWDVYLHKAAPPTDQLPFYTILTLSATASEYNQGAVISSPEEGKKLPYFFLNRPVATAIDPTVQFTLPWRQVMCGAVDATSHLLEQYFSTPNETDSTRQINLALQRSIIKSMEKIKKNEKDYEARANFCWAVSLALNGIAGLGLGQDWNVHYIEHAISAVDDKIAHGEGLAVVSHAYYKFLWKRGVAKEMFEEWAQVVYGTSNVEEALKKFDELLDFWGAPKKLTDLGLKEADIPKIVKIEQEQNEMGINSPLLRLTADLTTEILKATL
ncbi:putative Long-chain-alcohol dehydrogenase 2 [Blattamonas nauphoetae]|uniref:Long-chain-alcohol dehydrogenase 2 n=1 Tax=Blattamonas nauphoetae TaxID=2049346 RepID=A0ABQ9XC16_9EUKA|nr:putative Long-chain-alcohol dehydrogenase 2 [Blattamonas nauphoetae]